MAPPDTSIHAARVTASAPWAGWDADRKLVTLAADIQRGAEQFASMRLSAAVIGHSSSSFLGGKGWDEAIIKALQNILGTELPLSTNGLDCVAAAQASDIRRPLLVLPPWFGPGIVAAGTQYFTDHGIVPAATLSFDPGPEWHNVAPQDMYPKGLGFEQKVEPLCQQIADACPAPADGILIAGTGFRCVAIIEQLETTLGMPVITANQASLWQCLQHAGINTSINDYGRLLSQA